MDLRPEHDEILESTPGSALTEALRPGRGETAIGDNPRATGLLEITQLWADTILSVRHFGPTGRAVTLSGAPPRKRLGFSALLVLGFLLGIGGLGAHHLSLTSPPELSTKDEALIQAWTEQQGNAHGAQHAALQEDEPADGSQESPQPDADPLAERADLVRGVMELQLTRERAAMDRGRAERRLLQLPRFVLAEQPGWTRFVSDELLEPARTRAARGELPKHWRRALAAIPSTPDLLDDVEVARVAEDVPLGTRVRRADDEEPWTVTSGLDPDVVTLAREDGRRISLQPRAALWPWQPSDAEIEGWHALALEAAKVLYTDAIARRSSRATCVGAQRLLGFLGQEGRAELQARAGWCALNQGDRTAAVAALSLADGPLDLSVDPDAKTVLLRTRTRLARLSLDDAIAAGDAEPRRTARAIARASLVALRGHVVDSRQSVSELRAVAREVHHIELDALHERQEAHVRAAGFLGLCVLLLLPLALVIDERRENQPGSDFFVDGEALPLDPFPLVIRAPSGHLVSVPDSAFAYVVRDGQKHPASGEVRLVDGEQLVTSVGDATFVLQNVQRPRGVHGGSQPVDWGYLSVLAALIMVSAAFTVILATAEPPPEFSVQDPDARIVRIALNQPDPPTPTVEIPRKEPDGGEGARAPEPEGQRGESRAHLRKARGMRVAVRRDGHNQRMVRTRGLLGALDRFEGGIFGDDGMSHEVATAAGGLIGTQYGNQRGDGLASRGGGNGGGCMNEDCAPGLLSGVGTRPGGEGRSGARRRAGDLGPRGESGPRVGTKAPLVLGSIDKATVDRIVKQHLPSIRACYERELGRNPTLRGKLSVKFVIAKDGGVSTASSRNDTLKTPAVSKCVHARFLRMRFPKPRGGGIVTVNYPLVFDAR